MIDVCVRVCGWVCSCCCLSIALLLRFVFRFPVFLVRAKFFVLFVCCCQCSVSVVVVEGRNMHASSPGHHQPAASQRGFSSRTDRDERLTVNLLDGWSTSRNYCYTRRHASFPSHHFSLPSFDQSCFSFFTTTRYYYFTVRFVHVRHVLSRHFFVRYVLFGSVTW